MKSGVVGSKNKRGQRHSAEVRCGPRIESQLHGIGALDQIRSRMCGPEFKNNSNSLPISLRRNSFGNFGRNIPAIFLMVKSGPCDDGSRSGERKWRKASFSVRTTFALTLPASGTKRTLRWGPVPVRC
jgi:hypothetical protein